MGALAPDKVDCHGPVHDLTVECSPTAPCDSQDFDRDTARRRRSQHVAFTYGDVTETAVATVAELALLWPAR